MDWLMLYWLPCLCMAAGMILSARRLTHYFQLESYQFQGYFRTLRRQWKRAALPCVALAAGFAGLYALLAYGIAAGREMNGERAWSAGRVLLAALISASFTGMGWAVRKLSMARQEKKKFALTARMKRLYGALVTLLLALMLILFCAARRETAGIFFAASAALLPLTVALAGALIWPVERLIFHLYFRDAEKKILKNDRLIRIGITGSYGKTSTKFILADLLSQKYNVLATPASFNTPMGVTRIIRERLTPAHQVFIGEMGARHVGEIKELSRLVHPQIGILTAVGPQHLDTFRTLERIKKTKYELIEALPEDGLSVFLDDGDIVTGLYQRTKKARLLAGKEGADAWATDVAVSPQGSSFTLHLKEWEPIECQTQLLGEHNIRNILLCALVAKYLGLTPEQIRRGILNLRPVEHRLQLMKTGGGVTVIDDAFNTNPRSSKEALKVLSSFPGRHVIVTPGMVELGAEEDQYNEDFGKAMAKHVDIAVLVGRRHTAPIRKGMLEAGFPESAIFTVGSLQEAVGTVNSLILPGDTVMYENDLPDHYSEQ